MSQPPPSIAYRSGPPAVRPTAPSEYDHAYEQERGRWLRRRFIIYLIFSLVVGVSMTGISLLLQMRQQSTSGIGFQAGVMLLSYGVYIVALVFAWRSRPVYGRVLRVALATYLIATLLGLIFAHSYYMIAGDEFHAGMRQGMSIGETNAARHREKSPTARDTIAPTLPTTAATSFKGTELRYSYIDPINKPIGGWSPKFTLPYALDNVMYWMLWLTLLLSFAINHTLISMFLPWTVRDSLRPIGIIAPTYLVMLAVDASIGRAWWPTALGFAIVMPLAFVPGTLVCWWRYSRFTKQFRQQFESQGFRKLQDELVGARKVHESNLPSPISDGPIRVAFDYEPMREIGGDLLMLHRSRGGDAVTAVLFDVTGHGVSAALSVNRIVGEVERTFAEDADASPERVICNLNKYIAAILSKHQIYATAIVVRVDAKEGTLEYVNAGHPPAVTSANGELRELQPTAMMLGVCDGDDFFCEMERHAFAAGDALVVYTDGASEAIDPQDQMLGIAGTFALVRETATNHRDPASWPAAIHDRVVAHRQAPPTDDTLVVTIWRSS